jgi:predicted nucleic acid-binding Zn ribbon protein
MSKKETKNKLSREARQRRTNQVIFAVFSLLLILSMVLSMLSRF